MFKGGFDHDDDQSDDDEFVDIEQGSSEKDDETVLRQQQPFTEVLWRAAASIEDQRQDKEEDKEANISSQCCICLEEFKEGDECRVRSKCNHIYHKPCIDMWLLRHKHCPLCRGYVKVKHDEIR
ncbi:hypothetical protein ACOSP7_024835 [Xanthoceras sorbifolium]|uniref:RING-type domain-containing protein n=1 Tax=Xanthoceras sorbifolium TaxID=99658 RepID=A0ABQ8H7Y9_9ROSI|nr:hypothetical protein JRO89_XS13G0125900 [Xanthoceras sorbifolium]